MHVAAEVLACITAGCADIAAEVRNLVLLKSGKQCSYLIDDVCGSNADQLEAFVYSSPRQCS